jgi:hypothetical protein
VQNENGWEAWFEKAFATMGAIDNKTRQALERMAAMEGDAGLEIMRAALRLFEKRPQGLGGLKSPWRMFASEVAQYLAQVKTACAVAAQAAADEVIIEQNVQRQKDEHTRRYTATPLENGGSVDEYLVEL